MSRQTGEQEPGAKVAIASYGESRQAQFSSGEAKFAPKKEKRKMPDSRNSLPNSFQRPGSSGTKKVNDAEEKFNRMSTVHQRWLLSFPQSLKQLFFNFADFSPPETLMRQLLRQYPDLAMQSKFHNKTAIALAIEKANWDAAKEILEAWIDKKKTSPPIRDGQSVEIKLVASEDPKALELLQLLLLNNFVQVTHADHNKRNLFHHCALNQNKEAIRLLSDWTVRSKEATESCKQALSADDCDGKKPFELSFELTRIQIIQMMEQVGISLFKQFDEENLDSGIGSMSRDEPVQNPSTQTSNPSDIKFTEEQHQRLVHALRDRTSEFVKSLIRHSNSKTILDSQPLLEMVDESEACGMVINMYTQDSTASKAVLSDVLRELGLQELLPQVGLS